MLAFEGLPLENLAIYRTSVFPVSVSNCMYKTDSKGYQEFKGSKPFYKGEENN
ncbi:hypothetical protein BN3456_02140 [Clostridium sp. C105KSO13]|nr:hypothetical protein BN3456_02140 [Clostridium sp. C105KSO13]